MSEIGTHRDRVLGILAREGHHISEGQIGHEIGHDASEVANLLRDLQREGQVQRTEGGNWELTPAAASRVEPVPSPYEPRQG